MADRREQMRARSRQAGRMRPRTSPSGSPRRTTSSPSSRNVRVPSATRIGSAAVPGQLDQAALAAPVGAGDRARGHQVAGADARTVRRRVGELLRHRPVEAAGVAARDNGAVQLHLERQIEGPVALDAEVRQRLGLLGGRGDAAILEQRERSHPRRDRGGEALAEERAERHVLPRLEVAGAPVVDEHDAEDVLAEGGRGHRLSARAGDADDEAQLELEVEPPRRPEGRRVGVRRLRLPLRPAHRRAADDDRAGAAVVADGQMAPVREQRLGVGAEHAADVRRVLERRVEVDVVRDREREQRLDLGERDRVACGGRVDGLVGRALPRRAAARQQLVERALAEVDDGVAGAEAEARPTAAASERPESWSQVAPSLEAAQLRR